jgi:hypothetical protein
MESRCTTCNGTKHLLKLGAIYGTCNTCKGTGLIKVAAKSVEAVKEKPVVTQDDDYVLGKDEPVKLHKVDKRTRVHKSKLIAR